MLKIHPESRDGIPDLYSCQNEAITLSFPLICIVEIDCRVRKLLIEPF